MSFQIHALPAQTFANVHQLDDTVLSKRHIRRVRADAENAFPCRVSLKDAAIGDTLLLLNHVSMPHDTPYRAAHAIYVKQGAETAFPEVGEVPLALLVTMRRIKLGNIVFGHGNDETLLRRIRAHENFVEYVPFSLIVLGLAELQNGPIWVLIAAAILLVVGRIVHAAASLIAPYAGAPRGIGMLMTHTSYLLPALWLLYDLVSG